MYASIVVGTDGSETAAKAVAAAIDLARLAGAKLEIVSAYEPMAAAHVSGVAAMVIASGVLGRNPSADAVECQLKLTARNKPGQLGQGYDARMFGAGLVDAAAAVAAKAPGC